MASIFKFVNEDSNSIFLTRPSYLQMKFSLLQLTIFEGWIGWKL